MLPFSLTAITNIAAPEARHDREEAPDPRGRRRRQFEGALDPAQFAQAFVR